MHSSAIKVAILSCKILSLRWVQLRAKKSLKKPLQTYRSLQAVAGNLNEQKFFTMFWMEGGRMAKLLSNLNGPLNGKNSTRLGFTSKVIPTEVKLAITLRSLAVRSEWGITGCYGMKKIVRRIFRKKVW